MHLTNVVPGAESRPDCFQPFLDAGESNRALRARCPLAASRRGRQPAMCYLDAEEITVILRQPDRSNLVGQRDHALLAFLYNTGARIQEALKVCSQAIRFESPAQVRLFGKGRKTRICPLWPETVDLLRELLKRQPRSDDEPIFVNCYGRPLGAAGVRLKLKQYVQAAAQQVPSLSSKRVPPHTFRHSVGVQMVAAGIDVTIIRDWLGHAPKLTWPQDEQLQLAPASCQAARANRHQKSGQDRQVTSIWVRPHALRAADIQRWRLSVIG